MKDSDKIKMTVNIGGEMINLDVDFNLQDAVRNAETAVKQFFNDCKLKWPSYNDQKIMAMMAYQFSFWYQQLLEKHVKAVEIAEVCSGLADEAIKISEEVDLKPLKAY